MDILFWVVVLVAAALIALVIVSRSAARSTLDPTSVSIDPALATEVRKLYASNEKVQAIKALRAATGLGLADAVRIADKMAGAGKPGATAGSSPGARTGSAARADSISPGDELEIRDLIAEGRKIDAIRTVRRLTGMDLQEATSYVESL